MKASLSSIIITAAASWALLCTTRAAAEACTNASLAEAAGSPIGAGANPQCVAVGDFNRDGKPDLAVANVGSANVSVFLGIGDGTFQVASNYGTGTLPESVIVGDFNRDGKSDLAVANFGSFGFGSISILLGNGDGTFQAAVNYNAGGGPGWVAVGDFNSDGKPDLAVANENGNVSALLGNGDGSFSAPVGYDAGARPQSVAVSDFNGDGKADLIVANFDSDNISILLGKGDGTFHSAVNYGAGTRPVAVAVSDFNADGNTDVVVVNVGFGNNIGDGSVSVFAGNGDGTFKTAVDYRAGAAPIYVAVGDLNGDGKLDLAVANNQSNSVSILLGNGDGTFQNAVDFSAGMYPSSVAIGDFNRDGKPDLALSNYGSGTVLVLLNTCTASDQLLVRLAILADGSGGYFIRFNGISDLTYRLQRGLSATGPWSAIATNTAPASGRVEFHDTMPLPGQAFYRTLTP